MPFTNREKPRLFERLRGRSGQDLLNEVKSAFNTDNRMLFDSPTFSNRPSAFSRGFPFDEEPLSSRFSRNRSRPRQFVDRAAGFADSYEEPPWEEEEQAPKRRVVDPEEDTAPTGPAPLHQHGLRNTVPLVQPPNTEREGRAMSAPPGDRQARFTSSCEIPVNETPNQQQQSTPPQQSNNVRVIPIQVEGRDEPLINSNIDTSTNFGAEPPSFEGRLPRDFGPFKKHSARFQHSPPPHGGFQYSPPPHGGFQNSPPHPGGFQTPPPQQTRFQNSPPPQQQQAPSKQQQQAPPKQQQQAPSKQQKQAPPKQPSHDEPDRATPPPPPDPVARAMAKIAEVQREVEALAKQVSECSPVDKKDKQYLYLDEMLTRQLLHLDNVDPAGHDNIRQARKNAIKSIQQCISDLESRVPGEPMEVEAQEPEGEVSNEQMSQEESATTEGPGSEEPQAKEEAMAADATPAVADKA